MKFNFDEIIDREPSSCAKWSKDVLAEKFGNEDVLPLWVADMDFRAPDEVVNAIIERAKHGIYGYGIRPDDHYDSFINWMLRRYNWKVEKDSIVYCPGIVSALAFLIQTFTEPQDHIIIQTPVYYPFRTIPVLNDRIVVENTLIESNGRYEMDFEDLRRKAKDPKTKMLILSSPHNPVGRVWTKEELTEMGTICLENNVLIISDEIHCDIVFEGYSFIPFASISKEFAQGSIICAAPSKTFNLAGLQASAIIIEDKEKREMFQTHMAKINLSRNNVFSQVGFSAAYEHGEPWLNEYMAYIKTNLDFMTNFLAERVPEISVIEPEGTYLIWLDCRSLGFEGTELMEFMSHEARVGMDPGIWFSDEDTGFERINISCPHAVLKESLERIEAAVAKRRRSN